MLSDGSMGFCFGEIHGQAWDDVEGLAEDSWRTGFQSSSFNLDWDTGVP